MITKKMKAILIMACIISIIVVTAYMGCAMEGLITEFPKHGICNLLPRELWGWYMFIADLVIGFGLTVIIDTKTYD